MKGGREYSEDEVSFASGDIVHHYRNLTDMSKSLFIICNNRYFSIYI